MIPNSTPPISSAAAVETANVRDRNSPSGSSGSVDAPLDDRERGEAGDADRRGRDHLRRVPGVARPAHALASRTAVTPTLSASAPP